MFHDLGYRGSPILWMSSPRMAMFSVVSVDVWQWMQFVFLVLFAGLQAVPPDVIEAAQHRDIRLGGGAATIRQYLRAALIDEMHLAISPVLLGSGQHLLADIDAPKLGYRCTQHVTTANATHVVLTKGS